MHGVTERRMNTFMGKSVVSAWLVVDNQEKVFKKIAIKRENVFFRPKYSKVDIFVFDCV